MRDQLEAALKSSRADYTEIRLEETETTSIVYRSRHLETASVLQDAGGLVRCLCKDRGWGVASFNNRDDLPARVEQAYQCAQLARSQVPLELTPIPVSQGRYPAILERDFRGTSLADKKTLLESYNMLMLKHDTRIVDTSCRYGDTFSRITFANSEGAFIEEERPMVLLICSAIARVGDNVQQARLSYANQLGFEAVEGRELEIQAEAQRAVELLDAKSVGGGRYPVILNPQLAGVFIHEAFGHLSESDFVYENPKAREMMVLGRRFGSDSLNVFDDGAAAGQRGTHPFDDEGTPTQRTALIKNGILVGRLHSRQTAAKLGELPTGNARAINYRFGPIVRMTNTGIAGGVTPLADMLKDIRLGVYACDAYGGETALESFSFSSAYAYMIRDGQLAEMVKDVILAGNLFTTLKNIDAIGDDFQWTNSGGGCGKGDQSPLPISFGAPHIRIQDVIIGGQ